MDAANAKGRAGLAAAIRLQREEHELSQEALARLARCSTSTVRLVENGWEPSSRMLTRLADALGCDVAALLDSPPFVEQVSRRRWQRGNRHRSI